VDCAPKLLPFVVRCEAAKRTFADEACELWTGEGEERNNARGYRENTRCERFSPAVKLSANNGLSDIFQFYQRDNSEKLR
jgi:hypothetical protein